YGKVARLLVRSRLDTDLISFGDVELLWQLSVASGYLVIAPSTMTLPLTEDEDRRLYFEGKGDRFEGRSVAVRVEIVDQLLIAPVLPRLSVVANARAADDR